MVFRVLASKSRHKERSARFPEESGSGLTKDEASR